MAWAHTKDAVEFGEDNKSPSIQTLNQLEGCQVYEDINVNLLIENYYWRMRFSFSKNFFLRMKSSIKHVPLPRQST